MIDRALQEKPANAGNWSVRLMGDAEGVSKTTVQRWFGLITQRAIKRAAFRNVTHLVKTIHNFTERYNQDSKPFVWAATAQSILDKVERFSARICGTEH